MNIGELLLLDIIILLLRTLDAAAWELASFNSIQFNSSSTAFVAHKEHPAERNKEQSRSIKRDMM